MTDLAEPENQSLSTLVTPPNSPNVSLNTVEEKEVYFPNEITANINNLTVGKIHQYQNTDYSLNIKYLNKKIKIQTPVTKAMFGLSSYCHPGSHIPKYNIDLLLSMDNEEQRSFVEFVKSMDQYVLNLPIFKDTKQKYSSPIRYSYRNPNLTPVLRVKINDNGEKLLMELFNDSGDQPTEIVQPTIEEVRNLITHGTNVRCIIEINPVWHAGNKFGISYKLLQIEIVPQIKVYKFRELNYS